MDFKASTKLYLNIFHILGYSPYKPWSGSGTSHYSLRFLSKLMKIVHFILCFGSAIPSYYYLNINTDYPPLSTTETIIVNINLACHLLRATFVLIYCVYRKELIYDAMHIFSELRKYYANHMKHRVLYHGFRNGFGLKFFIGLGALAQYVISYLVRCLIRSYYTPLGILVKVLQLLTALNVLHIVFFIDALTFHLSELNAVIRRDIVSTNAMPNGKYKSDVICKKLKCYKVVHFHLWEIAQRLNTFFGWSMLTVLMHGFCDITYSAYWIFEELQLNNGWWTVLSKLTISYTFITSRIYVILSLLFFIKNRCLTCSISPPV